MHSEHILSHITLPADTRAALSRAADISVPASVEELASLAAGGGERLNVRYAVPGRGEVCEAEVCRCKNGISVNFPEAYMRRRDGACMRIGDNLPTDKPRFQDSFGYPFSDLRAETLDWLSRQELILLPFTAGGAHALPCLAICPKNAAFFALSFALMHRPLPPRALRDAFAPRAIFYVAPPFRHTHFSGRQIVVHCRGESVHEVFAYNLYPGPSAKKGVFAVLIDEGERAGRVCCHASVARLTPPGGGAGAVIMHEGASGGGKSEMTEPIPPTAGGIIAEARSTVTGERLSLALAGQCGVTPLGDDMVLSAREVDARGRLMVSDGEDGWFLRVDGERGYGSNPALERASIHPGATLEFFNLDCAPGSTCLVWEHTPDPDGKPCPNPRVILPRASLGAPPAGAPTAVDVRSFGVRMPPSTAACPDIGVAGLVQVLPAALAWLWRLVSPRGYKNPSVTAARGRADSPRCEGVGSYWPFCTGRRVTQANLLLRQIFAAGGTLNLLIPNQHVGAYSLGFDGQWLVREYLGRHGGRLTSAGLTPARCPLMGYAVDALSLDGQSVPPVLLRPELQPELGEAGYDAGAKMLTELFLRELENYDTDALDPLGREIIALFRAGAGVEEYARLG